MKIVQNLTSCNIYRNANHPRFIVIHYFGALGSAYGVSEYFKRDTAQASAHYAVDEGETIYQCVRDQDAAWHCGATRYIHSECRNVNSIGIEIRPKKLNKQSISAYDRDWYFDDVTLDHAIWLTKLIMERYKIPVENVIRHYDVTGKYCPRPFVGTDVNEYYKTSGELQWKRFKDKLVGKDDLDMTKEELLSTDQTGDKPSDWAKEATSWAKQRGIFKGDGSGNFGWQVPVTREQLAQILYNFVNNH